MALERLAPWYLRLSGTRLVSSRNSVSATRRQKLASDCYVIHAFINGERSKEILDMCVTSNSNPSESTINLTLQTSDTLTTQMQPPHIYLAIHTVQSELIQLSTKQNYNDNNLRGMQTEVRDIQTSFRVFQGTLNSILTRISDIATVTQVKTP